MSDPQKQEANDAKQAGEPRESCEESHVIRCPRIFGLEVTIVANKCDHASCYSECGRCPFAR